MISNAVGPVGSEEEFVVALRLRPDYRLPHVRSARLEDGFGEAPHDPSRAGPPGPAYPETKPGEEISFREILCTYSDEPDWGMDQDLFEIEEYGYGRSPFGGGTGLSSQAPFHMDFRFGNPLTTAFIPSLKRSFMEERIRGALVLARLALNVGCPYWGWRFTAWALHYLQDLTQPYHAKPFPIRPYHMLRNVRLKGSPGAFLRWNRNLLKNKHLLLEATVHFLLNDAFKSALDHPFLPALAANGEACGGTIRSVMSECGAWAARLATETDRSLDALFLDRRVGDPSYSMAADESYCIEFEAATAALLRAQEMERFIRIVSTALFQAGRVTRYVSERMSTGR